jgi:hypothetical protein
MMLRGGVFSRLSLRTAAFFFCAHRYWANLDGDEVHVVFGPMALYLHIFFL